MQETGQSLEDARLRAEIARIQAETAKIEMQTARQGYVRAAVFVAAAIAVAALLIGGFGPA